jgi:hypothetical protein
MLLHAPPWSPWTSPVRPAAWAEWAVRVAAVASLMGLGASSLVGLKLARFRRNEGAKAIEHRKVSDENEFRSLDL